MRKQVFKTIAVLIIALVMSYECISAQRIAFCYKGAWSEWVPDSGLAALGVSEVYYGKTYVTSDFSAISLMQYGVVYFKFAIDYPFQVAPKKVRKEHLKTGEWYVYSGTVEYYVNDAYPTAQEIAKKAFIDARPKTGCYTLCKTHLQSHHKNRAI